MKTLLFVLVFSLFSLNIVAQKLSPQFVVDQMKVFNSNDYYKDHVAYADTWAWGTALRNNGDILIWFAYTNTDAYFQISINDALTKEEQKMILTQKDDFNRSYDVSVKYSESWIGTSNDWIFTSYTKNLFEAKNKAYKSLVVNTYFWKLVNSGAIKKFRVGSYL